jgi:hypothetical protein
VTSQLSTFVFNRSSAFIRVIRLLVLATPLSAVLHAGSRVTCYNFLNLHLCFSKLSIPGMSLIRSEGVNLLLDNLYAEAIEAVKSQAAQSDLSSQLTWILVEINSEAEP